MGMSNIAQYFCWLSLQWKCIRASFVMYVWVQNWFCRRWDRKFFHVSECQCVFFASLSVPVCLALDQAVFLVHREPNSLYDVAWDESEIEIGCATYCGCTNEYFYTNLRTNVGNIDCKQHPYAQVGMRCNQYSSVIMYAFHSIFFLCAAQCMCGAQKIFRNIMPGSFHPMSKRYRFTCNNNIHDIHLYINILGRSATYMQQ